MARPLQRIERIEFTAGESGEIVDLMTKLGDRQQGWINLLASSVAADRSTSLGFSTIFNATSSGLTMCTWIPERQGRRGRRPTSLGISHMRGRRVAIRDPIIEIPDGWIVKQDHPRRGLVLYVAEGEPHERVLAWSLRTVEFLSGAGAVGVWRAEVHFPAVA